MGDAADRWLGDTEFEDKTITGLEPQSKGGWSITNNDGWSFFVPKDSPVAPAIGMSCRMYGRGIGSPVRGLFLDGQCVFYRTADDQTEYAEIQFYGADCEDLLARWDGDKGVFTVEMGGISPGYEQAIQITVFEILRYLLREKPDASTWGDSDKWKAQLDLIEKAVLPTVDPLGLSGAQWGAAVSLAARFYRDGPRATIKSAPDDRRIQVSRSFPALAKPAAA